MGDLGFPELLVILVLVVVLFGARRIPEVARGLGEGIRSFKTGLRGDDQRELESRSQSRFEGEDRSQKAQGTAS